MTENRSYARYKTIAKARIEGINDGDTLLKDLSITGCMVECTSQINIENNIPYKIVILPESAAKIGEFELLVEYKWRRAEAYSCEIGFVVVKSPTKKLFQRYVDYLSWRYSHGSSMTGSGGLEASQEK